MVIFLCGAVESASALDGPPGITQYSVLPPFNPAAAACGPPPGLEHQLAFVQENDREFLQGVNYGLEAAAKDRGLTYVEDLSNDDAVLAATQLNALTATKTGAIVVTSADPDAVHPGIQQFIWSGGFAGTIGPPIGTQILNAPQYQTGKTLADTAIDYINAKLGGKANVVILTQDGTQYLTPRFQAMRDELAKVPGVDVVADITPNPVNQEGGYKTMNTILMANAKVDVVLGADSEVLGALHALRATGKDRPDQFLGGIDGEPEAVAEIQTGDSPYKASIALSSPVFGYAMGQYAADWLEGKSVPQAMDILPIALTKEDLPQYEADLVDPANVFRDSTRRDTYLRMYGNICYDTRGQYVNFPWSSEGGK